MVGTAVSWDGSSWTSISNLGQSRADGGETGTSGTNGIIAGGETPPSTQYNNTETWDGTSWTEVNNLNTARAYMGSSTNSGSGMLVFSGAPSGASPIVASVESFDGTSWTEIADISTARRASAGAGTAVSALMAGGYTGTASSAATEEWTVPEVTKTLSIS